MCHTSLDARELNLRQHALERMTTDRRLAPGDDEPARRCTKHGESDLRRRALRFHRHHRLHGTAQCLGRRTDQTFSSDVDFARCRQQQARL